MAIGLVCIFELFEGRKVQMYFMDVNAPAQLISAPAQPPATELVVYTALFFLVAFRLSVLFGPLNLDQ